MIVETHSRPLQRERAWDGGEQHTASPREWQWIRQVMVVDEAESFWLSSFCCEMALKDISPGEAAHSCFSALLGLLAAAGLAEPEPQGVDCSLRRMKGYVHLSSEGCVQRYSLCSVTRKPHHQSVFALQGLQEENLVCTALSTLPRRDWVVPVHVTQE